MRTGFQLCQTKTVRTAFTKYFAQVKKSIVRNTILRHLREELERQSHAAETARDEAISEESRAENKWDTHSQEAAYLAEGQAKLAAEIGQSIEAYSTIPLPEFSAEDLIAIGAIIELETADGSSAWYFIGPRAGGLEMKIDGHDVLVLTPQSPLGRQLLGKRAGDMIQITGRDSTGTQRIRSVQ